MQLPCWLNRFLHRHSWETVDMRGGKRLIGLLLALVFVQPVWAATQDKTCRTADLSLHLNGGQGEFDGMSHSGTWLVFTNHGDAPCSLLRYPVIHLEDTQGRLLAKGERKARVDPSQTVVMAPHSTWRASLYWVSGDVYGRGRCVSPSRAVVLWGQNRLRVGFDGHTLCGPAQEMVSFEEGGLELSP